MNQLPPDPKIYIFPIGLPSWAAVSAVKAHNLRLFTLTLASTDLRRVVHLVDKVEADGVVLLDVIKNVAQAVDVSQVIANPDNVTDEQFHGLEAAQSKCIQLVG